MSRKMTEEAKEAAKLLFEFEKSPVKVNPNQVNLTLFF